MQLIEPYLVTMGAAPSRASIATYKDASGVLKTAAIDEPRPIFEVLGTVNLLASSTDFYDADKFGVAAYVTIASSSLPKAPDNSSNCAKITDGGANLTTYGRSSRSASIPSLSPGTYEASVFLKAGGVTRVQMRIALSGSGDSSGDIISSAPRMLVDMASGRIVIANGNVVASSIEAYANGWYRASLRWNHDGSTSRAIHLDMDFGSGNEALNAIFPYTAADTTKYFYAFGAQVEDGFVSSYIPSTGTSGVRAPDVLPTFVAGVTDLISSNVAITEATWNGSTAYVAGNKVVVAGNINVWECITGNTGVNPATDTTGKWLNTGAMNRWRMFDGYMGTGTSKAETIEVTVRPGYAADSLILFGLQATSVTVIVTDDIEGKVYHRTIDTLNYAQESTWHSYFFGERLTQDYLLLTDLPLTAHCTISVMISAPGSTAKCGMMLVGRAENIGIGPQYGMSSGIVDYSTITRDAFGRTTVVPRAYANRVNYRVVINTRDFYATKNILTRVRSKACAYIGSPGIPESMAYGYYKSLDLVMSGPIVSDYNLEVEGLT